jgi:[FeFe] hydrogenase H-cluster maturation GTPase HydF|tara:strand:- start:272 stop:1528 length:1257 start_codon:yes stop_codon:yes gene_type:complete
MLVERDNIGIFGKMNSGKSSLMNLLTQQKTSITDPTPGTTADTKITLQEIHGMGPIRLYDTAGANESNELGEKKRAKAFSDLKECDLVLVIIDPSSEDFCVERNIIDKARELDKQILIIYNIFSDEDVGSIGLVEKEIDILKFYSKIKITAIDPDCRQELLNFILDNFESRNHKIELFPFIEKDEYYILNIPMDVETPPGRYLRPQAMSEEYITRNWAYPSSFRMNLGDARSNKSEKEKKRFLDFVNNFKKRPKAIITDSQAMDIMHKWVPEDIKLTTFSITMINYFSKGRLKDFVDGIKSIKHLKDNDKVLIVEACNHSRIGEDIGTVQIPNFFKEHFPKVILEHNFGREFQDNKELNKYSLIIHCGGCMISSQKLLARLRDLDNLNIPYTNYGLFLAYMQGEQALRKVLEPWNIKF